MPAVGPFLCGHIFQELCNCSVCISHPDHRARNRLLRLKRIVHQKDTGLACIYIMFIFRVCEEAQLSFLAMLDFSK